MEKKITCEDIHNSIGELTDKKCPECNSPIFEDKQGTKWCSSEFCYWSNDVIVTNFNKSLM